MREKETGLSKKSDSPYCYLQFKSKRMKLPLFHDRKSNNFQFIE